VDRLVNMLGKGKGPVHQQSLREGKDEGRHHQDGVVIEDQVLVPPIQPPQKSFPRAVCPPRDENDGEHRAQVGNDQCHLLDTRGGLRALLFVACHARVYCGAGAGAGCCGGSCVCFSFSLGWSKRGAGRAEEMKWRRRRVQGGGADDLKRLETYGTLLCASVWMYKGGQRGGNLECHNTGRHNRMPKTLTSAWQ
jgi:hypothetical protein